MFDSCRADPISFLSTFALLHQAKHQFEQLREEIRNKNLEEINMLRISLDAQIEDLEQLFETAHLNYLQQTAQRTHDFKELTHKDQILDVDINQKKKKIDNLQVLAVVLCLVMPFSVQGQSLSHCQLVRNDR